MSDVTPLPGGFVGPVKRSVTIAGHQTSISLEPMFWAALEAEAAVRELPLNALIARIDVARIAADEPPNLASAIRSWLFALNSSPIGGGWQRVALTERASHAAQRLRPSPSTSFAGPPPPMGED